MFLLSGKICQQELLLNKYVCLKNQQSVSIDLREKSPKMSEEFSTTLWVSASQFNLNLLTVDSLVSQIILTLNTEGRLLINGNATLIRSFKLNDQLQNRWNFVYLHFQRQSDEIVFTVFINSYFQTVNSLKLEQNQKNLYLTLGSTGILKKCTQDV